MYWEIDKIEYGVKGQSQKHGRFGNNKRKSQGIIEERNRGLNKIKRFVSKTKYLKSEVTA